MAKKNTAIVPVEIVATDDATRLHTLSDVGHGANVDPFERLEALLERERIKGRMAIGLLTDLCALEARTRETLEALDCPSFRVLDQCVAPELVWLVVEPMVGTYGAIRAFRQKKTAEAYSAKGLRGLLAGPFGRHTQPGPGDVEQARQVLREAHAAMPAPQVGPFRDAHNVPAIAYELGRYDAEHIARARRDTERAATAQLVREVMTPEECAHDPEKTWSLHTGTGEWCPVCGSLRTAGGWHKPGAQKKIDSTDDLDNG